jgi:hypothetical protein
VVREAQSGKPVGLRSSSASGAALVETVAVRSSFNRGRYRIEDLAAGSYSVVALMRICALAKIS